jgi:heme O synthase-like polyprenyltransferase
MIRYENLQTKNEILEEKTMKKLFNKVSMKMVAISAMVITAMPTTAAAKGADLSGVAAPIVALINGLMGPALALVTAIGSLYCVLLGVKFAKAEEPQEREKAKSHLKSAIIGFVLIFVLILALNLAKDPLTKWVVDNVGKDKINLG